MADDYNLSQESDQVLDDLKDAAGEILNQTGLKGKAEEKISEAIHQKLAESAAKKAAVSAGVKEAAGTAAAGAAGAAAQAGAGAAATGAAGTSAGVAAAGTGATVVESAGAGLGAGTAAGSAVPGLGNVIGAVIGFLIGLVVGAVKKVVNDDSTAGFLLFVCIAGGMFFVTSGTLLTKGMSSPFAVSHETEFIETTAAEGNLEREEADAGKVYKEGTDSLYTYNKEKPLKHGINLYIYGNKRADGQSCEESGGDGTQNGLRAALFKAMTDHCYGIVKNLDKTQERIEGLTYDNEKSLETFYANRYPYDLAYEDFIPCIGDVLHAEGYSQDYLAKMDDVNFAEIMTILGQSTSVDGANGGFNWGQLNFERLMDFTETDNFIKNLYEMSVNWIPIYTGTITIEDKDENGNVIKTRTEEIEVDGTEFGYCFDSREAFLKELENIKEKKYQNKVPVTLTKYYISVKIMPFGLRELYNMAFGTPSSANYAHVEFTSHTNLDLLEYGERVTRVYQRDMKTTIHAIRGNVEIDSLGPAYDAPRSELSPVYEYVLKDPFLVERDWQGKGRSAWYYIENTYNDKFEAIDYDITWYGSIDIDNEEFYKWLEAEIDSEILLQIPEYFQKDKRWKDNILGLPGKSSNIGDSGCGFTSMAMIASYFTGRTILPSEIAEKYPGYYVKGSGMSHSLPNAVAKDYGFDLTIQRASKFDASAVVKELEAGHPVLVSFHHGLYTQSGHLTVVTGVTKDGGFIVHDPSMSNKKKYGTVYSLSNMEANVAHVWAFEGNPPVVQAPITNSSQSITPAPQSVEPITIHDEAGNIVGTGTSSSSNNSNSNGQDSTSKPFDLKEMYQNNENQGFTSFSDVLNGGT